MKTRKIRTDSLELGDKLSVEGTVVHINFNAVHRMSEVVLDVNGHQVTLFCTDDDVHELVN